MIKKIHIILLLILSWSTLSAQRESFFENWFSVAVENKLNDFTWKVEEGWRVREFYLSRQNYTDVSLDYKVNDFLNVSGGYRLILKNHMFNVEEANNRFYIDLTGTYESGDYLEFSLRSKFQYTKSGMEDDIQLGSETFFRNRFKTKLKVSKELAFSAGYEMLLILVPASTLLTENRLTLDASYKINKRHSISLGYILRNYVQVPDPTNINIVSVDYAIKL